MRVVCVLREKIWSTSIFKALFYGYKKDNKGKKGHKNMSEQDEMCMLTKSKKEQQHNNNTTTK